MLAKKILFLCNVCHKRKKYRFLLLHSIRKWCIPYLYIYYNINILKIFYLSVLIRYLVDFIFFSDSWFCPFYVNAFFFRVLIATAFYLISIFPQLYNFIIKMRSKKWARWNERERKRCKLKVKIFYRWILFMVISLLYLNNK